jgi:hypothetical protein
MRYWHLYEEKKEGEGDEDEGEQDHQRHQLLSLSSSDGVGGGGSLKKKGQPRKYPKLVYRYDWLLCNKDIQTIQDRIIEFVISKKEEGRGANAIDNYLTPL